jgi:glycosyltransferase involved in cell wall biosynthesis
MLKFLIKKPILIKFGGFIADELHPNIRSSPLGKTFYTLETLIDIYLLRHADIILVSSLTMKESIEKMFGIKSKILLCPSGIDLEKIERIMRQENVKKDDKVRIGFLGSLTWWQGVDILTEAVAIVKEKLPNIELFIVGDGPMREKVVNMCKKHKIAYTITGFVPHEEALKYLRSFDVLVLPRRKTSATEANIPIKVVEAWTLGVPVIVTKHRVFLDYQIKNYEDVIYCEPEPNSVANAIFTLLTNNELKETLKTNGPKLARQFDYDKIAERILRAIID